MKRASNHGEKPQWLRDRDEYFALCRHLRDEHGITVSGSRSKTEVAHEVAHRPAGPTWATPGQAKRFP